MESRFYVNYDAIRAKLMACIDAASRSETKAEQRLLNPADPLDFERICAGEIYASNKSD